MIGVNDYCKIERTVESKCELGNPFLSIKGLSENRLCNPFNLINSLYTFSLISFSWMYIKEANESKQIQ